MKNRKALSIFVCTLLLSTCLLIKTENTNNFTKKELLWRMANYGLISTSYLYIVNYIFKPANKTRRQDKINRSYAAIAARLTASATYIVTLELLNNYGPDKTYIEKVGKNRFISNIASITGITLGRIICGDICENIAGKTIGVAISRFIGASVCGAVSDYILNEFCPPKNLPLDPSLLKKNTAKLQQFINSKQSNNFSNNSNLPFFNSYQL